MDFKFIINTDVLAIHLLTKLKDFREVKYELEKLRQMYPEEFNELFSLSVDKYLNVDGRFKQMLEEFKKSEYFKKMYSETKKYKRFVLLGWKLNKKRINKFLSKILRINIDKTLNVYISHPYCSIGYNSKGDIFWGHWQGERNIKHNLIYLVHEAMHTILPYKNYYVREDFDKNHAIIELISEYELKYFLYKKPDMDQGHEFLLKYRYKLYPYWLKYIGLSESEIQKRIKNDKVVNIVLPLEELSKLNIYEFVEFILNKEIK